MKYIPCLVIIALFWMFCTRAEPIITLFLHPFPEIKLVYNFDPHHIKSNAKHTLRKTTSAPQVAGVFALYAGYIDASDSIGQIVFPRKQIDTTVTLIITNRISPVLAFENTVDHWQTVRGNPATAYQFSLHEDEETGLSYWIATTIPLPDNLVIPREAIVLLVKPSRIYIPLGVTPASKSANLLLPNIYVKKGVNFVDNAFYMLNMTQWFRPNKLLYQKQPTRFESLIGQ